MQIHSNLFPLVYDFESLYWSYRNARKGKRWRQEIVRYTHLLEDNLIATQNEIIWKSYKQSPYREFYVHVPKKRLIMALPFRDRVVQWSVYMALNPILERKYIYDSYACRVGKGSHASLRRLRYWLQDNKLRYYLTLDIHKYFYRVVHDILINSVYGSFIDDVGLMWLLEHMIRADDGQLGLVDGSTTYDTRTSGVGMAVGNLVNQMNANAYMNECDQYAKHDLKIKHYMRYMDDIVVLSSDKVYLHEMRHALEEFLLSRLSLRTNSKTQIRPVSHGINWVGYRVWPTHVKLRKSTAKRMKHRLASLQEQYSEGAIDLASVNQSVQSYFGILKHCDSYNLRDSIFGKDGWFWLQQAEAL